MNRLLEDFREAHTGASGRISSMRILTSLIVIVVMAVYAVGAAAAVLAWCKHGGTLEIPDIPLSAAGLAAGAMGVKAYQRGREHDSDHHAPPPRVPPEAG